jgi:predicted HicB family RNase H-like nuclease
MIEYKGFRGTVEFDPELDQFHGRVLNTRSVISFYGSSVKELQREMKKSVDTYFEVCEEKGIEPEKAYSGKFGVRIDPKLHRDIALAAASEGKSMNEWVAETLAEHARGGEGAA